MVLTPQLLQAIKLLQMPSGELTAFIEAELERNPAARPRRGAAGPEAPPRPRRRSRARRLGRPRRMPVEAAELARELGTEIDNAFDPDRAGRRPPKRAAQADGPGLSGGQWSGGGGGGDEDAADIEAYVASAGELFRVSDPAGDGRPARSRRPA